MPITAITNATGQQLTLWDAGSPGHPLAVVPNGGTVQHVPITITSVTLGGVSYDNHQGGFLNDNSYRATFVAAPATVLFTGNGGSQTSFT